MAGPNDGEAPGLYRAYAQRYPGRAGRDVARKRSLSREALTLRGHTGPIAALACSPDGLRLASTDGRSLRIWSAMPADRARAPWR